MARIIALLASAALTASLSAPAFAAPDPQPSVPMLTPMTARDVAEACPGTARFALALVRGASLVEATEARPAFAACAAQPRLAGYEWKTEAANLALGGCELTIGIATGDVAALRRAAAVTADLRSSSLATDDQIREWTIIPDAFNSVSRKPVFNGYVTYRVGDSLIPRRPFTTDQTMVTNAAYVNVAARRGEAWIHTAASS